MTKEETEGLVMGIAQMIRNPHSWQGVRSLIAGCYFEHGPDGVPMVFSTNDVSCPRLDEAASALSIERAKNIAQWLAAEYEIRRRETP